MDGESEEVSSNFKLLLVLAKSFMFVLASEILYNLSSYVVHSGMGRILGPADYGRYGIVVTLTTMIIVLIGNGIPTAMAKHLSEIFETKPGLVPVIKRQAAIAQTVLISAVTIIFYLVAPYISLVLGDPSLTPLFRISTLIIPAFALASFYFSYFTGIHRFKVQAFLKTLRSISRIAFILGLAWYLKSYGLALEGSIVGYILAPFIVFLGAQFFYFSSRKKPEGTFNWKKLIHYAWPVTLFMLAYEFLITIDLYLVKGIMHDDFLTGIYNGIITVGRIPYYLFYALTILLLPAVSKSTSGNKPAETKKLVSQSLRLMVMFLIPICILMSIYSHPIIQVFYSKRFLEAAEPMSLFVFGVGFLTVFYVTTFILNGAGKVKIPMIISFIGLATDTIITFILIKYYGLWGAVIGTSLTSLIIMSIILVYTHRFFGYLFKLSSFIKILIGSIILYGASFLFPRDSLLFPLWSVILLGIYLIVLYLLKEVGPYELNIVKEMLARKKKVDL
ncbi:MAG: flippase [Candidatus Moraniibacteriota bacterium]